MLVFLYLMVRQSDNQNPINSKSAETKQIPISMLELKQTFSFVLLRNIRIIIPHRYY